jgi:hypothetical protein
MPKITNKQKSKQAAASRAFHPYGADKAVTVATNLAIAASNANTNKQINKVNTNNNTDSSKPSGEESEIQPLSRGQKKRQERKEHIMQKIGLKQPVLKFPAPGSNNTGSTTLRKLPKETDSNKGIDDMETDDLDDHGEEAQSLDAQLQLLAPSSSAITSNKLKKQVAIREATRLKVVQQHPVFLEDPLSAIQKHLQLITGKTVSDILNNSHNANNNTNNSNKNKNI